MDAHTSLCRVKLLLICSSVTHPLTFLPIKIRLYQLKGWVNGLWIKLYSCTHKTHKYKHMYMTLLAPIFLGNPHLVTQQNQRNNHSHCHVYCKSHQQMYGIAKELRNIFSTHEDRFLDDDIIKIKKIKINYISCRLNTDWV